LGEKIYDTTHKKISKGKFSRQMIRAGPNLPQVMNRTISREQPQTDEQNFGKYKFTLTQFEKATLIPARRKFTSFLDSSKSFLTRLNIYHPLWVASVHLPNNIFIKAGLGISSRNSKTLPRSHMGSNFI
jgi:hypothetical protein